MLYIASKHITEFNSWNIFFLSAICRGYMGDIATVAEFCVKWLPYATLILFYVWKLSHDYLL